VDARQEGNSRPSHYTFPPQSATDFPSAYFVDDVTCPLRPSAIACSETMLTTFQAVVHGVVVQEYALWKLER
jgi:hypothetical protein